MRSEEDVRKARSAINLSTFFCQQFTQLDLSRYSVVTHNTPIYLTPPDDLFYFVCFMYIMFFYFCIFIYFSCTLHLFLIYSFLYIFHVGYVFLFIYALLYIF